MPTPNWCFYQRSITPLLCTNEAHHLPAAAHPHGFAAQQQNRGLGGGQNGAFAWLPPPGRSAVLSRSAGVSGVSPLPAAAVQMVSFAPHAAMQSLLCGRGAGNSLVATDSFFPKKLAGECGARGRPYIRLVEQFPGSLELCARCTAESLIRLRGTHHRGCCVSSGVLDTHKVFIALIRRGSCEGTERPPAMVCLPRRQQTPSRV